MNCIFQSFVGPLTPGAAAGIDAMRAYAARIGAEYILDRESRMSVRTGKAFVWNRLTPVYDARFQEFDRILYADTDVFPLPHLNVSVFDEATGDFCMAPEPDQPAYRASRPTKAINATNDERWAAAVKDAFGWTMPRDEAGRLLVFNAGVILWSAAGLAACRRELMSPAEYVTAMRVRGLGDFYRRDQNYLHAHAFSGTMPFTPLDVEWNRQVHGVDGGGVYDRRTAATKMVHIQLSAADHRGPEWHRAIVNGPATPALLGAPLSAP